MKFGPQNAEVLVFTFKRGLLSAVAHNLKIRVTSFEADVDEGARRVDARFDPASLRVVSAMRDGQENPSALTAHNRETIEKNLRDDVLHVSRFGEVRFVSTAIADQTITGQLTLHGVTRPISGTWRDAPDGRVARFELDQPAFGITPYTAMMGTLKVEPTVRVEVRFNRAE